ncbi:unnamed protein product, partial [Mesorhabditis belari]|uniref:UNC93-like protein MFSD11 n=1 Tax=Mesorhabditis belari TaxID=2138241 RepID=A0AAF3ETY4_9BILA
MFSCQVPDLFVVIQQCIGFFFVLAAYNGQIFIVVAVLRNLASDEIYGISDQSGYYTSSILCLSFTLSNFLAPPILARIGPKWAMVIGALFYALYMFGFLYLRGWLLYTLALLLGIGSALIWTGNGVNLVRHTPKHHMHRNNGIMWTGLQMALIAGALFLAIVLQTSDLVSSYQLVYAVFGILALIGAVILACLPKGSGTEKSDGLEEQSTKEVFARTFSLVKTRKMLMLTVVTCFLGAEGVFHSGVYGAALAATTRLQRNEVGIAYNVLALGLGEIIGGLLFGVGAKTKSPYGRRIVVLMGTVLLVLGFLMSFLFLPVDSPQKKTDEIAFIEPTLWFSLATAFVFGLGDSCWQTQAYTIAGGIYKDKDAAPAFALFQFFQAGSAGICFYISSILNLYWQLGLLSIFAILSTIAFYILQQWALEEQNIDKVTSQEEIKPENSEI